MKFTSIWDFRMPMALKERINRTLDLWAMKVDDILPRRVRYWVALREIGKATMKSPHVPATPVDDVLRNLGNLREGKDVEAWEPPEDSWFMNRKYHTVAPEGTPE